MHDSVALERAGLPTAVIVTTEFLDEARTQLVALGMPELEPVTIAHPLSTLSDEQIARRAIEAAPQVVRTWLAGPASPTGADSPAAFPVD